MRPSACSASFVASKTLMNLHLKMCTYLIYMMCIQIQYGWYMGDKQMGVLMFPNLKNYKSATRTLQLTEATVSASQGYIVFLFKFVSHLLSVRYAE